MLNLLSSFQNDGSQLAVHSAKRAAKLNLINDFMLTVKLNVDAKIKLNKKVFCFIPFDCRESIDMRTRSSDSRSDALCGSECLLYTVISVGCNMRYVYPHIQVDLFE